MAAILDRHFSDADAPASRLADAFHDVAVPIHANEYITAAALRADRRRVQHTGRWLVRHSTDRCSTIVGAALLASDRAKDDIPLIQIIGLLSDTFGPLAANALRRRADGERALRWLAQRVTDGDFLNGCFAGKVATAGHLHEAITSAGIDDELVDHLTTTTPQQCGCTTEQRDEIVRQFLAVLNHPDSDRHSRHRSRRHARPCAPLTRIE